MVHGERHALREPEGSGDNKGVDAARPLATIQHAVNMAGDSKTTIRLGPGTFRGNELLPTGWKIPVALADHIAEPVSMRDGYIPYVGAHEDRGSAYFYFRIPAPALIASGSHGLL